MSDQAHAAKPPARAPAEAAKARAVADSSAGLDPRAALRRPAAEDRQATFRASVARRNETGLPDRLKAGLESLSGFSMDNVRVYYGSSKPAALGALAYARGTDIHLAPGQERHLPHEAWHVVQQKQGRVRAAYQLQGGDANSNAALEHEASVMGSKATNGSIGGAEKHVLLPGSGTSRGVLQPITAEQIEELQRKLERDKIVVASISYPEEGVALVNKTLLYKWVRGLERWAPSRPERQSGGSFYGRLENTEISTITDLSTMMPRLPTGQADESGGGGEEEDEEARESQEEAGSTVSFTPASSSGGSRATGDVMGKYFFSRSACLSASDYLLAGSGGGFEWLHMRADSLGGDTVYGNLYAGGRFANTHMAAFEKAVAAGREAGLHTLVEATPTIDSGHHTPANCTAIVDRVRAKRKDKKNPFGAAEVNSLMAKPSQKLKSVCYRVSIGGSVVWEQDVGSLHLTGAMDQSLFIAIQQEVTKAILREPPGLLSMLNTAGGAGAAAVGGAASGGQRSASSADAMQS